MMQILSQRVALAVSLLVLLTTLSVSRSFAAPVLPEVKPPVPVVSSQTQPARILPDRKPPYYGPFGQDYVYLLDEAERRLFSSALAAAKSRQWRKAADLAEKANNPLVAHIIAWLYLRETGARTPFNARIAFIRENPDWPQINTIRERAEEAASDKSLNDAEIIDWFSQFPP